MIPKESEQPPSDDSLSSRELRSTLPSPQPRQPTSPHPGPDPSSAPPACLCLSVSQSVKTLRRCPPIRRRWTVHLHTSRSVYVYLRCSLSTLPAFLSVFHRVLWHWIAKSKNTEGHSSDSPVCILKHKDSGRKIMMALFMSLSERQR